MNEVIENGTEINKAMNLGKIFAESGMFPDIKSASQGYIKLLAGKELGLSAMQSINSFYFVGGRLGITSQAMSALVKKSDKYDYSIQTHTEEECTIAFYLKGEKKEQLGISTFNIKMAAKAGIVNKSNWKNYPMNMLFARALMNGIRWFCPDAVSAGTYATEELEDLSAPDTKTVVVINDQGEVENG